MILQRLNILSLLGLVAVSSLAGAAFSEELRIVAIVNEEVITQAELDQALAPMYFQMQATLAPEALAQEMKLARETVLDKLIEGRLMLQEARNPKPVEVSKGKVGTPPPIEVSPEEVEERLEEVRAQLKSTEAFEEGLRQQGLTLEGLRQRFRDQLTIQKLIDREIRSRVSVSPSEVSAYYEAHRKKFMLPPAVQVATILIRPQGPDDLERARGKAEEIERRLAQGENFYALAQRFSDGLNAEAGGRIGYLEQGKSIREIEEVLFKLKPGEISPVLRTPAGYHLFLIESVRPAREATLEEMRGQIHRLLREKKAQARYQRWMAKLKAESYILIK